MKKFVFSVASRATGRLQIKPSGSGDENEQSYSEETNGAHAHYREPVPLTIQFWNRYFQGYGKAAMLVQFQR